MRNGEQPVFLPIRVILVYSVHQIRTPVPLVFEVTVQFVTYGVDVSHSVTLIRWISRKTFLLLLLNHG